MNAPIPQGVAKAFEMLPVDAIAPSNTATQARRRKRFDEAALSALTRDVQDKGVIEPILVIQDGQRLGEPGMQYEIVAGERRWLASRAAGLSHIPAIITNITRDELVAFQVVENKLREALHPLDEAEAIRELMDKGLDAEAAGAKIGLKRSQAHNRLKLLALAPEVLEAIESGRLDASKALVIARAPTPKLQKKALTLALERNLSERQLDEFMRHQFFVALDDVPFDTGDPMLDPERGACIQCQHCSLNDPELHAELQATQGVGAFLCMDKPCHNKKVQLHFVRRIDEARKSGQRIIEGAEAEQFFRSSEDFTRLDNIFYDAPGDHDGYVTYRQFFAKTPSTAKLPKFDIVLMIDKQGQPHEVVSDKDLDALLKAHGVEPEAREDDVPFTDRDAETASEARERMDREQAKRQAQEKLELAHRTKLLQLVHEKFKGPLKKPDWVRIVDTLIGNDLPNAVVALYGEEEPDFTRMSEADLQRYAVELVIGPCVDWAGRSADALVETAGRLRIDVAKVRKQVKAEIEGKDKPAPKAKAKAGKQAKKK